MAQANLTVIAEQAAPNVKHWWRCRTSRSVLRALHLSGIPLRNCTLPDQLADWEGPFADPHVRLPQHPAVRRERQAAARR